MADQEGAQIQPDASLEGGGGQPQGGDNDGPKQKTVPLDELIEWRQKAKDTERRLRQYEADAEERKKSEMSEIERAKSEAESYRSRVAAYEQSERKQEALRRAKAKMGDGFTLDGREDQVQKLLGKVAYNEETLNDDILEIVNLVKVPRQASRSHVGLTPEPGMGDPKPASFEPGKVRGRDLVKLRAENPERFEEVAAGLRENSWPQGPQLGQPTMVRPPLGGGNGASSPPQHGKKSK